MDGRKLWGSSDIASWNKCIFDYEKAVEIQAKKKKKPQLIDLDKWFQKCLGNTIRSRKPFFMDRDELIKMMEWKITRGKFRPQLPSLIAANKEESVDILTKRGLRNAYKPENAIKELCELRGVGPATASAILTAYKPERYCFMADEAVASVIPGKIDYTLKYYLQYLKEVMKKSKQLSALGGKRWTPHDVELALWAATIVSLNEFKEDQTPKRMTKRKFFTYEENKENTEALDKQNKEAEDKPGINLDEGRVTRARRKKMKCE